MDTSPRKAQEGEPPTEPLEGAPAEGTADERPAAPPGAQPESEAQYARAADGAPHPGGTASGAGARSGGGPPPEGDRPRGGTPPAAAQDQGPLRRLRRWAMAATVLALIATGVAVLALFTGDIDDRVDPASARDVTELSEQVDQLQDRLASVTDVQDEQTTELDRVSSRLDEIDQSVSDLRSEAREPSDEVRSLSTQVDELESRLQDLESGGGGAGGSP